MASTSPLYHLYVNSSRQPAHANMGNIISTCRAGILKIKNLGANLRVYNEDQRQTGPRSSEPESTTEARTSSSFSSMPPLTASQIGGVENFNVRIDVNFIDVNFTININPTIEIIVNIHVDSKITNTTINVKINLIKIRAVLPSLLPLPPSLLLQIPLRYPPRPTPNPTATHLHPYVHIPLSIPPQKNPPNPQNSQPSPSPCSEKSTTCPKTSALRD
ncbi:hypothetical protein P170DRAFT_506588 [Aspergillus steynii IBT 23096]|uniref:Uncharacterized protein n=1 Tax=Aspergillus steynii IBT 23096 TaxID=1392250 RepID=A0A2I2GFG1_9EURO|nr:uncharacterized protein P170DRAFT_506588 [Aspergillus steynii IBT 23096]PLB51620.1 hypothetical protein P170DRAFT_506588 [Aspergillus steynii IBT 23096]